MHGEVADHVSLAEVLGVIKECIRDLDTPSPAALPELVERLARQRLTDRADTGQPPPG